MKSETQTPVSSTVEIDVGGEPSENALRELDNQLSNLIKVTNTLETQELSEQFVAIVSHDLRTPLSSVQMSIDMISDGLFGELTDLGKQQLKRAQRSIERMNELINDLLDLERLKSGSFSVSPETLRLDKAIKQAIEATELRAREQRVSLIYREGATECFADGRRLMQVMINLIDNAIKFSNPGQSVEITSQIRNKHLEIQVTDRGRGIPEHMQAAVFNRFVQISREDRLKRNGSGLGLAICKEIVLNHGGEIGVRSKPGRGSTFWFRLPMGVTATANGLESAATRGICSENGVYAATIEGNNEYVLPRNRDAQLTYPDNSIADCVSFSAVPSDELPLLQFQQCLIEAAMAVTTRTLSRESDSFGQMELREQLQQFLQRRRGIHCSPDQIVVFNTTEGGLDLLCRLIVERNGLVATEDPCFPGIGLSLAGNMIESCPVPIDAEGISIEALNKMSRIPSLVYVTPAHQDTIGLTMSFNRRLQLLDWARKNEAWIVEDDYGSEFSYEQRAPNAMLSLDNSGTVIYKYNFWKALYPLLRLSFMIIPNSMITQFRSTLNSIHPDTPYLEQVALSLMIKNGHYERHLDSQQKLYSKRRDAMLRAFEMHGSPLLCRLQGEGGTNLLINFRPSLPKPLIESTAKRLGIKLMATHNCYQRVKPPINEYLVSFCGADEEKVEVQIADFCRSLASANPG